jgi:tRNA-specific 2-thiouridylase
MKTRVVVAMSGGVDSSVAAALLKNKGYEVIGITMCFGLQEINKKRPSCCGIEGIEDARRVAHTLGIRHYVLNFDKFLRQEVIKNFVTEYISGRTPNPCVRCNQYLKFEQLLNKAKALGARYLATGHYARIVKNKKYSLKKAKDRLNDQSYFLYRLTQKQMPYLLMPLGGLTKVEVRKIASDLGLATAQKPASQEICFIPDENYRGFLKREFPRIKGQIRANIKPGPIMDREGNVLGGHKGIPFYTIGQREGLGIALGYPVYVIKIEAKNNTIVVGRKEDAYSYGLIAGDLGLIDPTLLAGYPSSLTRQKGGVKRNAALKVKIRYNHKEIPSEVMPFGKNRVRVKIIFSRPQFAVTPGQSVVFYRGEGVVGGGIIEEGLADAELD